MPGGGDATFPNPRTLKFPLSEKLTPQAHRKQVRSEAGRVCPGLDLGCLEQRSGVGTAPALGRGLATSRFQR